MTCSRRSWLWGFALALTGVFAAAGPGQAQQQKPLDKVILRINFTPWGMHAPYFYGLAKGIYREEGIDLEIRPPSTGQQNEGFIASGREQFGVTNADAFTRAKGSGLPIVAIMAEQPDTPFAVASLKADNITQPSQLKGKKISWFHQNVKSLLLPLLKAGGLKVDDVEYVVIAPGTETQLLAARQTDVMWAQIHGQPLTMEMRGFPMNVMALKDYGVKFYGVLIYTNENLVKTNPDLVQRFVKATTRSIMAAMDNPDAAVAEVIKVSPDRDQKLETTKLKIIQNQFYKSPDFAERFGKMNDDRWQSTIDYLKEGGDLGQALKPSDMYTNKFVDGAKDTADLAQKIKSNTTQ
ncbi:ABC transporter substrate-binding protein [Aquabacter sp. CN5-332]|uniref:ABC transporter substrate-binding protein n=1 Tax=Aquabacter sp. CN5-332 TaxID=3156608 RepID=UPI0032B31CBE